MDIMSQASLSLKYLEEQNHIFIQEFDIKLTAYLFISYLFCCNLLRMYGIHAKHIILNILSGG